ncbi:hypothetical protein RJ641_013048, partial [Dillenia turbinata]
MLIGWCGWYSPGITLWKSMAMRKLTLAWWALEGTVLSPSKLLS